MLEDIEIIALVKSGNADAFTEIIERYKSPIFRYLYRLTNNYDIAQDIMQDTFIQAFQGLSKTEMKVSFKSWLYRIATNNVLMVWRRRKVLFFVPLKEELRAPESISEDQSASIGIQMDIQNILARIPEKQRVCMVLHFVEGFKYKEIAASLGVSEEAVRKRVTRGSQEFKRLYNSEEVG